MLAMVTRELIVAARRPAVPLAACAVALLLAWFVLVWFPGIALLAPWDFHQQTRVLLWLVLAILLPWAAVRSALAERSGAFVRLACFTAVQPAVVVAGKILGTFTVLVMITVTAVPVLVIAQQMAAVPFTTVIADVVPLIGTALFVAVSATASTLLIPDRLSAWVATTLITWGALVVAARWLADAMALGLGAAVIGLAGAGWLCVWSSRSLLFLGGGNDG